MYLLDYDFRHGRLRKVEFLLPNSFLRLTSKHPKRVHIIKQLVGAYAHILVKYYNK